MRSSALKKEEYFQDNEATIHGEWELFRARIAKASHAACSHSAAADLGAFEEMYGARGAFDFA